MMDTKAVMKKFPEFFIPGLANLKRKIELTIFRPWEIFYWYIDTFGTQSWDVSNMAYQHCLGNHCLVQYINLDA